MTKDKISIQEIIDLVASKAAVSKRAAEEFLKILIATIEDALLAGESVKIKDFGTFKLQWNEPRKSVNIQTGEDIMLSGYYKVTFTPDTILKGLVNEPFAHLEPVVLDSKNEEEIVVETELETEVELNPLRIFEEQASEIKNLLSEIQALSPNSKKAIAPKIELITEPAPLVEIEPINELLLITDEVNDDSEKNSDDTNYILESEIESESKTIVEEITSIIEHATISNTDTKVPESATTEEVPEQIVVSDSELEPNPFVEALTHDRKSRKWLWISIVLVLLIGGGVTSYFFFPPATELATNTVIASKKLVVRFKETASTTEMLNMIARWVTPAEKEKQLTETVIIPKEEILGDSIFSDENVDSLQLLFDTPRIYPEYISTEKIVSGSRLARMSERYYGLSDFWVYIYEANKDRIANPDNIPSGTLIYIPKVDARLIDATNPRCIKKARELHDLYVKKTRPAVID